MFLNGGVYCIGTAFTCPNCSAQGENAESVCEANIEYKPCLEPDPVCAVMVGQSSDRKDVSRFCLDRRNYMRMAQICEGLEDCAMAMCDTSGCKAETPRKRKYIFMVSD